MPGFGSFHRWIVRVMLRRVDGLEARFLQHVYEVRNFKQDHASTPGVRGGQGVRDSLPKGQPAGARRSSSAV